MISYHCLVVSDRILSRDSSGCRVMSTNTVHAIIACAAQNTLTRLEERLLRKCLMTWVGLLRNRLWHLLTPLLHLSDKRISVVRRGLPVLARLNDIRRLLVEVVLFCKLFNILPEYYRLFFAESHIEHLVSDDFTNRWRGDIVFSVRDAVSSLRNRDARLRTASYRHWSSMRR